MKTIYLCENEPNIRRVFCTDAPVFSKADVLANPEELGRKSDKDVFIFLTGGMGTEDVAWGYDVYTRAKELGLGKTLSRWEKPHWA